MNMLDTTVRDGSYAVDFKFSCEDVKNITGKSNKLGFSYIEIGHGQGLHASSLKHGLALHTDEEYIQAALESTNGNRLGFFCIPGIAQYDDLHLIKDYGLKFVRIGVNAQEFRFAQGYIEEAKRLGLTVMTNFMKTYTISPDEFASACSKAEDMGSDYAYIVDSAGCMLPQEIECYYDAARSRSTIGLGFHGHNNMGLAVSNSVYCVEKGFDLIDSSFQGIGRSCGNASTEMLVMTLKKMGYPIDMDIPRLLEYGYSSLKDVVNYRLIHPLDLMCGYAGFHSGYLKFIYKCCVEKQVDPLRLILAYSQVDQTSMNYEILCSIAQQLPIDIEENPYNFREFFGAIYND